MVVSVRDGLKNDIIDPFPSQQAEVQNAFSIAVDSHASVITLFLQYLLAALQYSLTQGRIQKKI